MILAGLPSALAWRLARTTWPILNDWLLHIAYCSKRTGLVGTCQHRDGRCTTCRRRRIP